jgi:hypothetical protein
VSGKILLELTRFVKRFDDVIGVDKVWNFKVVENSYENW